jgi:beta-phosphoglucomutase-like phosphatase (HAD superfamily)
MNLYVKYIVLKVILLIFFLDISCVVVEDSNIGLSAAKAAGMKCIVTKSG